VDGQLHDQVAGGAAELAGVPAALVADLAAVLQPGRDVDGEGGVLHQQPLAAALGAGRADLLAGAGADRAGGGGDQLAEQRLADGALLARAVAARADGRLGPGLGPRAAAARAGGRDPDPNVLGGPEDRLGERQAQAHPDGLAPPGPRAGPGAAPERVAAAEELAQQVVEGGPEAGERVTGLAAHALHPGLAVGVVALALVRVGQHGVGLVDLAAPLLGLGVVAAHVRVVLAGQPPPGALDLVLAGGPVDAQQLVVVAHPLPVSLKYAAEIAGHGLDGGHGPEVVHPGRAEDADGAAGVAGQVGGGDQRAGLHPL